MSQTVKVLFLNNEGGGFADHIHVEAGTTVGKFLQQQMGETVEFANYLIRVNRQPIGKDYVLKDGDRVTATPVKLGGSGSRPN